MDAQKMRWLSLRDERRGDRTYRCSLFVTSHNDGSASLVFLGYQLVQYVLSSYDQRADVSPNQPVGDQFYTDKESDLLRAEQILYPYKSETLSAALEWIEANGFVADMYVLAALFRALDE